MQLGHKSTDLDRYIYLVNLLDHNEVLFYRTVMSDPARFLPIVYDPTIGEACLKFGHIYRQARGMYLSMTRLGKVKDILKNWPQKDVRFICVTDGGRILGLGDLGPTAPESPSASCSCTPLARACHRNTCCPCISMPVPTTSSTCTIRFTWACASPAHQPTSSFPSSTSSLRLCKRCFRNAAFISRIGQGQTLCTCCSATATSTASITTMCRHCRHHACRHDQRVQLKARSLRTKNTCSLALARLELALLTCCALRSLRKA